MDVITWQRRLWKEVENKELYPGIKHKIMHKFPFVFTLFILRTAIDWETPNETKSIPLETKRAGMVPLQRAFPHKYRDLATPS